MGSICTCAPRRAEGASLFFQYLETKAYEQLEAVALTSVKPRKWRLLWVRRTPSCVKSDFCKNKVQIKNSNRPVAINDMRSLLQSMIWEAGGTDWNRVSLSQWFGKCLVRSLAGMPTVLRFFLLFLSPSRRMLQQYVERSHFHFLHMLFNS
jgi:hypothetical protein